MDSKEFYDKVYDQDTQYGKAHGWIQWKGTDACIDVHCECGHLGHVDAMYFYFYECPECHRKYAVGQVVKLIPLTEDQEKYIKTTGSGFITASK